MERLRPSGKEDIDAVHVGLPPLLVLGEAKTTGLGRHFRFDKTTVVIPDGFQGTITKRSRLQGGITFIEHCLEGICFHELIDNQTAQTNIGGMIHGSEIPARETTVAIIKQHSERFATLGLPLQHIVLRPVEVGAIHLHEIIVHEARHIHPREGIGLVLRPSHVGGLEPASELAPIRTVSITRHTPEFEDIHFVKVDIIMVLQIAFVGRFLQGIDAPILPVDEHGDLTYIHPIDIQFGRHSLRQIILSSCLTPMAAIERTQVQMLEVGQVRPLKKAMLETLLAVFLAGIEAHAFLLVASRSTAVGTQSSLLVDAAVVLLIKLHIAWAFPFPAFHVIIACRLRIGGIIVHPGNEDTCLIVEQIQGIDGKGQHGQAVQVATQIANQVGVGRHLPHPLVVFIKSRRPEDDGSFNILYRIIRRWHAVNNRIDV